MVTLIRRAFSTRLINLFITFTLLLPSLATAQPALAAGSGGRTAGEVPAMALFQNNSYKPAAGESTPLEAAASGGAASPEATPEPTPLPPTVGLTLSVQPDAILPGSPVTLTWTVENWDLLALPAILEISLPEGLKPLSPSPEDDEKERSAEKSDGEQSGTDEEDSPAASARGEEKILRIPLKEPRGSLGLAVAETARGPFSFFAAIFSGQERGKVPVASAGLNVAQDQVSRVGPEGGVVTGLDGRVRVEFPAGAMPRLEGLPQGLRVHVRPPSGQGEAPYYLGNTPFKINAEIPATAPGEKALAVTHFSQPITITVSYSDTQLQGDENFLSLYYFDTALDTWVPLLSRVDIVSNTVTATSDHLTTFDVNAQDWEAARLPNLKDYQVSPYSGSASYSLPLQVPPGPGGLQPGLALSYNSATVDGANGHTQGSWIGMGWNLDTGYIQRSMHGTMTELNDDTFTINASGVGGMMLKDQSGYYHTTNESFWRIQYVPAQPNQPGTDYWLAWDKTGNQYFFGLNDAERAHYPNLNPGLCASGQDGDPVTWRWGLSKVRNIYGQELVYHYYPFDVYTLHTAKSVRWDLCGPDGSYGVDLAMYPREIIYPNGHYRVLFNVDFNTRQDYDAAWLQDTAYTFYDVGRLASIDVQHDNDLDFASPETVRRYEMAYASASSTIFPNYTWPGTSAKTLTLQQIREYGYNLAGPLPATTFTYGDGAHLTQAENGYGGVVTFTYEYWYETQSEDPAQLDQSFGYPNNLCYSDQGSEGGWGGHCLWEWVNYEKRGTELRIDLLSGRGIDPGQFRPGGVYRLRAQVKDGCYKNGQDCGNSVNLGLYDGQNTQYAAAAWISDYAFSWVEATLVLPGNATLNGSVVSQYRILCEACDLMHFQADLLPTYYRVASKTVTDQVTGQSSTVTYRYDDPATNDAAHSAAVAATNKDTRYSPAYSDFRGHAMVQETTPDGLTTTTFFHQDDAKSGSSSASLTAVQTFYDGFDNWNASNWAGLTPGLGRLGGDQAITLTVGSTAQTLSRPVSTLSNGEAVVMQFQVNQDRVASPEGMVAVDSGTWNTSSYRRWGVRFNADRSLKARLWTGTSYTDYDLCDLAGQCGMTLDYDKWYVALLIQDAQKPFVRLWLRDDPSSARQARLTADTPVSNARFGATVMNGGLWLDGYSEGNLYSLSETVYETTAPVQAYTDYLPVRPGGRYTELAIYWNHTTQARSFTFGSDSSWVGKRTDSLYETAYQGGTQYGNQTGGIQYSASSAAPTWAAYRATRSRFYPNTTGVYLVGLPANANTFKCAGSDPGCTTLPAANLVASTLNLYDGNTAFSQAPAQGVLSKQRTLLSCTGNDCSAAANRYYADVAFGYDAYGNRTTTTAYTDATMETGFGAGQARTSTTVYESTYHTYPIEERNPLYGQGFPATTTSYAGTAIPNTAATGYTLGVPVSMTDANGATTTATYDAYGRMTAITRPDGGGAPSIQISYHDTTQPFWTEVRQKSGAGANDYLSVRKFYNGLGQRIQVQQAGVQLASGLRDVIVDTFYDPAGRAYRQSVPYDLPTGSGYRIPAAAPNNQPYTQTAYDLFGRTQSVTAPDGTQQAYSYDDLSTTAYDPRNPNWSTVTRTDVWGRTVEVDPPAGPSVTYTYDYLDRLDTATRTAGVTTDLDYDLGGRKVRMVDPDMGTWNYTYDALGNLTGQSDARGCATTLSYDALNRLTGKSYGATGCGTGNANVSYTYDSTAGGNKGWGRRTGMSVDSSNSAAWTYDLRGRTTRETRTIDGLGTFVTQWTYTLADQPATMTYPDGEVLTYGYHAQGALNTLMSNKDDENLNANYYLVQGTGYEAAGRVEYQLLAADALAPYPVFVNDYTYNGWNVDGGRLQRVNAGTNSNQTSLLDLRYDYDAAGNITSIQDYKIGSPQTQVFTYDAIDRLRSAYAASGSMGNYASQAVPQEYTYNDTTGNLASKAGVNYTYSTTHKHAVASTSTGWSYQYDANGNMTRRDPPGSDYYDFSYDAENRLYQVKKNNVLLMTFTYDGDGARIKAAINGGATTVFVGGHYEVTGSTVTKYYTAGGQRLAMRQGNTLTYLLGDHLGSTSVSVNVATPGTANRKGYYPWGETRFASGTLPTKYQFTGQYSYATGVGGDFGLMYYNARWYDPMLGRFAQADTVVPLASQGTQAWDRYAYTNNNPLLYVDPSGHSVDCAISDAACRKQVQNEKYLAATVTVTSCDSSNGVYVCSRGLGTKIGDHTVLTDHHYSHKVEEADVVWLDDPTMDSEDKLRVTYEKETPFHKPADVMLISTNQDLQPTAPEIPLAGENTLNSIGKGDTLTLVYHGKDGELVTGDFNVLKQENGYVYLENPNDLIAYGDSGGGAFYNGMLVGNTTGTVPAEGNAVVITLNPGWVTDNSWHKWNEEDF